MQINFYTASLAQSLSQGGAESEVYVSSITTLDGETISTSDFSVLGKGYLTIDPQSSQRVERISFTGVDSTGIGFTGAVRGLFNKGGTGSTSTNAQYHPVGSPVIIAFGADDIFDLVAYMNALVLAGAPNASTTTKGIVQLATQAQVDARTTTGSTSALLTLTPDKQRSVLLSDYIADTGTANVYAIAPVPAISSYAIGQSFSFKAANANSGTSTLNVNGLGAKNIFKVQNGSLGVLASGDILTGQVIQVEYDGSEFQVTSNLPSSINNLGLPTIFGDGSDGTVVISTPTSLSKDMFYANLTVNSSQTLTTNGFRVYVSGVLTINGKIDASGGNGGAGGTGGAAGGTAGTAGAAVAAGSITAGIVGSAGGVGGAVVGSTDAISGGGGGGSGASGGILAIYAYSIVIGATGIVSSNGGNGGAGGAGGSGVSAPNSGGNGAAGSAGTAGNSASPSLGVSGTAHGGTNGNGGAGAATSNSGQTGGAGGTSGAAGTATLTKTLPHSAVQAMMLADLVTMTPVKTSASAAAGAGGGAGGSGSGAATDGAGGGGGGGYGGSGGVVVLLYHTLTNSGSITVNGGTAGAAGAAGSGSIIPASPGVIGLAGAAGVIYSIAI